MADTIKRDQISFASNDGTSTIYGHLWRDEENTTPRGIIQIAHGMAEHIERYDDFARFLASHGYVVTGHNHIGHGSSSKPEKWGCLPAKNGKEILVEDLHAMRIIATDITANYPLPHFLFGHSLGSYITRAYLTRHSEGLAGAVICGTGHVPPVTSTAGNVLAKAIARVQGEDTKSKMLDDMGVGAYAKAVPGRTPVDWLSFNEKNARRYLDDEECGFMFSAGGYATVTSLTREVCTIKSFEKMPAELPLFFIAGTEDPVGNMGKGVEKSYEMAREAGMRNLNIKLYQNMRHEILNETNHEIVYEDVLKWTEEQLCKTSM